MSIDKLCMTVFEKMDIPYLEERGDIYESDSKTKLYQFFCKLSEAEVFWKPHMYFDPKKNYEIPYSKIDLNPKYFPYFSEMYL